MPEPVVSRQRVVRNHMGVLVGLSLDVRLTGGDLAALTPEQIRALFRALATIAALAKCKSA
ncbi:hypothetical protein [Micromonospora pisi]|nr:hypothetical protein [Micromonospora pisi]